MKTTFALYKVVIDIVIGTATGTHKFTAGQKVSQKQLTQAGVRGYQKYFKKIA